MAERRFFNIDRKFQLNPKLGGEYWLFMQKYINFKYMQLITISTTELIRLTIFQIMLWLNQIA